MAFSFLTQELAIDLGTANTVVFSNDKKVVDEPSIIAIDQATSKPIAYGKKARTMHERTNPNIKTIRPMKDGVIADFNAAELMIRGFIKMTNSKRLLFAPNLRIVIAIPSGSTEVEIRAVRDAAEHSGGKDVYLIFEPMAAALGIGLNVDEPCGHLVVDIGGGTTECAVISLGGIVCNESIKVAGDMFTADIQQYMRQQHNVKIGEITAEQIKIAVGAAITDLENPPEPFLTKGPNLLTAYPVEVSISSNEIAHALDKSIVRLETVIIKLLEQTPPELYSDIVKEGVYLSGGGALIRGLDKRFEEKLKIPFHIAEDPLRAVARGTNLALKNLRNHHCSYLMR